MGSIIFVTLFSTAVGIALWQLYLKESLNKPMEKVKNNTYFIAVMFFGFIAHIIAGACFKGHPTDMACFSGWSDKIFKNGLAQFYADDGFHDYPPGYVYVMYVLGMVKNALKMQDGPMLWIWLKLPAIIADMVMGFLVYKLASKKFRSSTAAAFSALVLFNPAVIVDSASWGQIDSILALFCLLAVYFTAERKYLASFLAFAAGVLIKPQAAFFAPILVFGIIDEVFVKNKFDAAKLGKIVVEALIAIAAMFILFMPFGPNPIKGIGIIIEQYIKTLGEYNYMTINAFNIYAALGKNWEGLTTATSVIGYGMMIVSVALAAVVFFKSKNENKYYIASFIISFGIYMLAVKMHERYAFPAIFVLIYALVAMPDFKHYIMYVAFSLCQFFGMAWVLFIYNNDINLYFRSSTVTILSLANIIFMVVSGIYIYQDYISAKQVPIAAGVTKNKTGKTAVSYKKGAQKAINGAEKEKYSFNLSEPKMKLCKFDYIAIAAIMVVYGVIALHNLGDKFAPQTEVMLSSNEIKVDLGSEKDISKTAIFLGARELEEDRAIDINYYDSNNRLTQTKTLTSGSVFYWNIEDSNVKARYVGLSTKKEVNENDPTDAIFVKELVLTDKDNNVYEIKNASDEAVKNLVDEQEMYVPGKSYMSGTYFDEIYHGRTAYEFIHNMTVYEWTHPPLGKVLMGIGILIYGMVPFGWRIVGTIVGVLMIPVIYIFARRMLKYKWLAVITCLLFTFDFMHFAQTRIATIDVYVTFFIMIMYYFMYKYYKMSFYDTPLVKTLIPLGLSGIFFGLAVASKWTGLYAGVGLAIIFFYTLYQRYDEYRHACIQPNNSTSGIEHKKVIKEFKYNMLTTLSFCIIMFIVVPGIIYTLSYIPYFKTPSGNGLSTIFDNARSMLTYHSKTVANSTHPYSSHWYEWPIMYRPIWYFSNTTADGLKQGISSFGNPAVWWLGIGALAYTAAIAIVVPLKKRNYCGLNKYYYALGYAVIFLVIIAAGYRASLNSDKLERLVPCLILYSVIMVGMLLVLLTYDEYIKQKSNKIALFLLIGYFAELVPWVGIVRTTYIYHYFPCVPFVVLFLGYTIKTIYDNTKHKKAVIIGSCIYAAAAIGLFALFYPVISGAPISLEFAQKWLKWFSSWVLIA